MRETDEFGTEDGLGIVWRDELKFGSTDGIWRLADVESAITTLWNQKT